MGVIDKNRCIENDVLPAVLSSGSIVLLVNHFVHTRLVAFKNANRIIASIMNIECYLLDSHPRIILQHGHREPLRPQCPITMYCVGIK